MQILVVQVRFGDLNPSASHFSMSSHRSIRHRRLLLGKRVGRKRKPWTAFCSPKILFYVPKSTTALQGVGRLVCIVLGRMLVVSGCNRNIRSIECGCHLCILDELGVLAHFHGDSSTKASGFETRLFCAQARNTKTPRFRTDTLIRHRTRILRFLDCTIE
jgi:hypothetical protein